MPRPRPRWTSSSRVSRRRGASLLVNYRPEYEDRWAPTSYHTRLRVDPLTSESADELLGVLLGSAPPLAPLKALLKERTGGNPLFLEESIRSLVDAGALVGEPGAYRLGRDLGAVQVPATVQALLASRIDRLAPDEKHLLQCGDRHRGVPAASRRCRRAVRG